MFTGIVDHSGRIANREDRPGSLRLEIACRFSDLVSGESISVDGCCLTVTELTGEGFSCDLSEETLRLTRAAGYTPGASVNLERALRMGDRLGGHIVTGHVDRTASVLSREDHNGFTLFRFGPFAGSDLGYLVPKGSLAVNGVSLTLNDVSESSVSVTLIPHTLEITNLSRLRPGDVVNIEFDWMTKLILNDARVTRALHGGGHMENRS